MTEQLNLGETPTEKKLIDEIWHNIWVSRVTLDAMQKALMQGEYASFLEFTAAMSLGWMVVGDCIFSQLLTPGEQEELTSKEAQSDLERLVLNYMREVNDNE